MSEENKVESEAVSEETTQEATGSLPESGALVAESKKYRKRAQDAEAELQKVKDSLNKLQEDKLKEKEDFKTLYEQNEAKINDLTANADKWAKYESTKRETLLESIPEEKREKYSNLDLEILEDLTKEFNNAKANPPEVAGTARSKDIPKDWTNLSMKDLKENWGDILKSAEAKMKR